MSEDMIQTIRDYLATQPVLKAWIFGSYARGEERDDSDVDLLVEFDHDNATIGLFEHIRMILALEERLGKTVDMVPSGTLPSYINQYVDNDKHLIYTRQ